MKIPDNFFIGFVFGFIAGSLLFSGIWIFLIACRIMQIAQMFDAIPIL